ncbi:MAG: helix-turn-helix domain-containing protein [Desulfobacterales bacterium]|nr:helix-turn-helix domain-containing protein [Desulfobacterales bacterium]
MHKYTLKELSSDLDISIGALRKYVKQGVLRASKVGRSYLVTSADLDKFLEALAKVPYRNYYCRHYDECLYSAARANEILDCEDCQSFIRADIQEVLWGAVYKSPPVSIQ